MPKLAVVIPTKNRGCQPAEAAAAILRDSTDIELVIVDQSTNEETAQAVAALPPDSRMRLVRSSLRGASNARNLGVAQTKAPLIAFTDDDCRPDPDWASTILRLFEQDPKVSIVAGRVALPEGALVSGYGASFEPEETERIQEAGIPLPDKRFGIGANFAIKRELFDRLGGFDPMMGPGTPHIRNGGEDTDLVIRALHEGHRAINASECSVLHLGVRQGADGRALLIGYQLGTGAAFGKLVRLKGASGLKEFARWTQFYATAIVRDVVRVRRPRPSHLYYFLAGALMTLRYDLDRQKNVFVPRGAAR